MTPKSAFAKICRNLNSYEFTEEFKKGRKLIEASLERERKQTEILRIFKWLFSEESLKYEGCPFAAEVGGVTLYFKTKDDYKAIAEWLEEEE